MTQQFLDGKTPRPYPVDTADVPDDEINLSEVFQVVRRRWKLLVLGALVGLAIGMAYAATTTKLYTSSVQLSLDAREAANARELTGLQTIGMSESEITTEIEVIRSQAVAEKVVERLSLAERDAFMQAPQTGLSRLRSILSGTIEPARDFIKKFSPDVPTLPRSELERQNNARSAAVSKLRTNMAVTRLRDSRVVQVSFTSRAPTLSALVVNTVADVYIDDQLSSKFDATQRATDWLKERSDQLRDDVVRLDNEVERFKRENDLLSIDTGEASTMRFERIAQQLSQARAQLVEKQAQQKFLEDIIETGDTSAAVSSTSDQSITSGLRSRYLAILKDYNSLRDRLGEEHEQTLRRERELRQLQELLFEEIKRSEEVARNEVVVLKRRIEQLDTSLAEAETELGADQDLLVELRELERNASSMRSLYTSFLQKYQQSLQEQSFTVSNVRVLNPAQIPGGPSSPNTSRITILSVILGLFMAAAWVAFVEYRDRKVRTGEQVQIKLGLEFLGGLQEIKASKKVSGKIFSKTAETTPQNVVFPPILRYGVDKPLSNFSETLRGIKMAIKLRASSSKTSPKGHVVGVFSAFPGEGKTTVSSNLANFLSSQDHKVLVVDGDLRNPAMTKSIRKDEIKGLVDVLHEGVPWQEVVYTDPDTGLDVIANKRGTVVHTSDLIGGEAMERLIAALRTHYDYIVLDLPPLAPVLDARATLPFIDGFVLVMKWGRTNIDDVERILSGDARLREKCYGVVLNFFDPKKARQYGYYSGDYYYGYAYRRYYVGK